MKIKTNKERFLTFLRHAGMYSGGSIEDFPIILKPDVALIDVQYTNTIGSYGRYLPQYFDKYDVDKETKITITGEMFDYLRGFRSKSLNVETKDSQLLVSGERTEQNKTYSQNYKTEIIDIDAQRTGFDMGIVEEMLVPSGFDTIFQATIPVDELSNIKTADSYVFTWKNERLVLTTGEDIHEYKDELVLSKVIDSGDFKIKLDGKLLRKIISNMVGDVLVAMNNDGAVFASGGEYWRHTYLLTGMIENW